MSEHAERLRVFKLSAGDDSITELMVRGGHPGLRDDTVGPGNMVENVRPRGTWPLSRQVGIQISMIVDETGLLKNLPVNRIASRLYDGITPVCGDAWLIAEQRGPDGDYDHTSLPDTLTIDMVRTLLF